MQIDLKSLWAEIRATIAAPRDGARRVLDMNLPINTAALALLVVALLTSVVSAFVAMIGQGAGAEGMMFTLTPLNWAIVQVAGMFFGALAIDVVGRWFGGTGRLPGAIAVLAWMQFILLVLQLAQLLITLLIPPLALPVAMAVVGLTFWLLVNFVAELHGFSSLVKVFFGILGAGFAIILGMSILLSPFAGGMGG